MLYVCRCFAYFLFMILLILRDRHNYNCGSDIILQMFYVLWGVIVSLYSVRFCDWHQQEEDNVSIWVFGVIDQNEMCSQ